MKICAISLGCFLILNPYWQAYSEPVNTVPQDGGFLSQVSEGVQSGLSFMRVEAKNILSRMTDLKEKTAPVLSAAKDSAAETANTLPTVLPLLSQTQWLKYLEGMTASAATKFDKALDARYLQTAVGGGNHRMFDGGHTIGGAWSNVARMCAETRCSNKEQIDGYFKALWKDATTPKGLPFMTMEKQTYDSIAQRLNKYGISKNWTYDALSYDALEVLAAGISAAAVVYFLKTEQIEELSEALGAMGVVSILSANPILALVMISAVAYAIATGTDLNAGAATGGIVKTSIISGALVLLPGVFLVQISAAVALSILLEKGMTEKNYSFAKEYLLEKTPTLKSWSYRLVFPETTEVDPT